MEHKKRRFPKKTSIYKYYPTRNNKLAGIVCGYNYEKEAPLSTLQKHLRVKHNFSIRKPLSSQALKKQMGKFQLKEVNNFKSSSSYHQVVTPEKFEEALASWIANDGISSSIITSPSFQNLFRFFDKEIIFPSRSYIDNLISQKQISFYAKSNQFFDTNIPNFQPTINSLLLNSKTSIIANSAEIRYRSTPPTSQSQSVPIHSLLLSDGNRTNHYKQDSQREQHQTLQKISTFQTPYIVHSSLLN